MRFVKKFQLVLCEEMVEIFDQLFELAYEEDREGRKVIAGTVFESLIDKLSPNEIVRLVVSIVHILDEPDQETRFNMVQALLKEMVNEEVNDIILRHGSGRDVEFEFLKEEP